MILRAAKGLVGSTVLASGTYAGLCYYAIWNAEQRAKRIEDDIAALGLAVKACEAEIGKSLDVIEATKRRKSAADKKVEQARKTLDKAEEQVKRLRENLTGFEAQVQQHETEIAKETAHTGVLRRMLSERAESVTVARQALSAAHKEALRTRNDMDPIKRLQIDKWVK